MFTPRTRLGVTFAAISMTVIAAVMSHFLIGWLYPPHLKAAGQANSPYIVALIALPLTYFVWDKVRVNAYLRHQLQRMVERDRLTDVATRDFFFQHLSETPDSFGISLMVDIDHFKDVNDNFGHLAGDRVIKMVADALRAHVRQEDVVCRFGGEEFVVFLSEASKDTAWQIAERLREQIASSETSSDLGTIKVTVSIGGSMKQRLEEIEEAIQRADVCLYRAKKLGRNRTVVDWRSDAEPSERHGVPKDRVPPQPDQAA